MNLDLAVTSTCACGATMTVEGNSTYVREHVDKWRSDHQAHLEMPVRPPRAAGEATTTCACGAYYVGPGELVGRGMYSHAIMGCMLPVPPAQP